MSFQKWRKDWIQETSSDKMIPIYVNCIRLFRKWHSGLNVSPVLVCGEHFECKSSWRKFTLWPAKLQMFDNQSCQVQYPIRSCFSVMCSRLDASDGYSADIAFGSKVATVEDLPGGPCYLVPKTISPVFPCSLKVFWRFLWSLSLKYQTQSFIFLLLPIILWPCSLVP